jgi:hypothetical protein
VLQFAHATCSNETGWRHDGHWKIFTCTGPRQTAHRKAGLSIRGTLALRPILATVAVAGEQRTLRSERVLSQQAGSRRAQLARLRLRLFLKDIFGNRPTGPRPLGLNRHGAYVSFPCHGVTTPDRVPSSLLSTGRRSSLGLPQIRQCRRRRGRRHCQFSGLRRRA